MSHVSAAISIHAPLAGSDGRNRTYNRLLTKFQSTLPLRGATLFANACFCHHGISIHAPLAGSDSYCDTHCREVRYFNPRSPCGERRNGGKINGWNRKFQSTLPLRGATIVICIFLLLFIFQSTLPLRGATEIRQHHNRSDRISIHAPLAGSDYSPWVTFGRFAISIHAPLAGSDDRDEAALLEFAISIHAPLAGSDLF